MAVATLIAEEDAPENVFAKVAEETGRLLGGVECTLLRADRDGYATNVGCWGETIASVFPVGTRFVPDSAGDGVAAVVLRTGRSYRIDDYAVVVDPVARGALDRGIESAVGCPIAVRGALWGAILVTGTERFPPETEPRITQFADLVAYLESLRPGGLKFGAGTSGPVELPPGFAVSAPALARHGCLRTRHARSSSRATPAGCQLPAPASAGEEERPRPLRRTDRAAAVPTPPPPRRHHQRPAPEACPLVRFGGSR